MKNLPKRPHSLRPIFIVAGSLAVSTVPQWVLPIIDAVKSGQVPATMLPDYLRWLMPLAGIFIIGAYAAWLQWTDRRRYDEIFESITHAASQYQFEPLRDLISESVDQTTKGVISYAKQTGRYEIPLSELNHALAAGVSFGDLDRRYARLIGTTVVVHPDLILPRS